MELYVLGAGVFVFVAHLLEAFFERFRVPDILCLMLLGVLIGPAFGWLTPADFGQVGPSMGAIALVVILFEGGLNLKASTLLSTATRAVPFSLISFSLTVLALFAVCGLLLDLDPWVAVLTGFILGGTSSAVVIPIVRALRTREGVSTLLTVESAITDVLCIVGTVGIVTGLTQARGVQTDELLLSALTSLLAAVAFGGALAMAWIVTLHRVQRMEKSLLMTLAYALVTYGVAEMLGISGAIAALTLGVVMGNVREGVRFRIEVSGTQRDAVTFHTGQISGEERKVYAEMVFLLKAFFFFHLGLTVRPGDFFGVLGLVALLLAVVPLLPRYPVTRLLLGKRSTRKEGLLAWALVPRGLAAAVLAQLPVQMGIDGGEMVARMVAMMVFASISLVAALVFCIERGWLDPIGDRLFTSFAPVLPSEALAPEAPSAEASPVPDPSPPAPEGNEEDTGPMRKAPAAPSQERSPSAPAPDLPRVSDDDEGNEEVTGPMPGAKKRSDGAADAT